jgi:hypothetical protein
MEQRRAHCLFDIAVVEIHALAQLGYDASQKHPACLTGHRIGGHCDNPKLTITHRDHALVVCEVG